MSKEKINAEKVEQVFYEKLEEYREKNGESKYYTFNRMILDDVLKGRFPDSSQTERSNAITAFLKGHGANIKKTGHGVYQYISDEWLSEALVFNTINNAINKIADAKISMDENVDPKLTKKICVLAAEAEKKLKALFDELVELAPEFEAKYNAHLDGLSEE